MENNHSSQGKYSRSRLRSLTRLLIGGVELGLTSLNQKLDEWESEISRRELADQLSRQDKKEQALLNQTTTLPPELLHAVGITSTDITDISIIRDADYETSITKPGDIQSTPEEGTLRHSLIGLVFVTEDTLINGMRRLRKLDQDIYSLGSPVFKPMESFFNRPVFSSARNRFDQFVLRGQIEVSHLAGIGIEEEKHSLKLAERAFYQSIDGSLDYLSQNQGLQELVQSQSTTLATEVVYEVRERTVSADNLIEGLVRYLFRRLPREELPGPPAEVVSSASDSGLVAKRPKKDEQRK